MISQECRVFNYSMLCQKKKIYIFHFKLLSDPHYFSCLYLKSDSLHLKYLYDSFFQAHHVYHVIYITLLRMCEKPSQIISVLFKSKHPGSILTAVKMTL